MASNWHETAHQASPRITRIMIINSELLREKLQLSLPIVQAPLPFYPNQTSLAVLASHAGCLGTYSSLGKTLPELERDLASLRQKTKRPVAVVVSMREPSQLALDALSSEQQQRFSELSATLKLSDETLVQSVPLATPVQQLQVLRQSPPSVLIFQDGLPDDASLAVWQNAGVVCLAIASNLLELSALEESSVDGVILQGVESAGCLSQFSHHLLDISIKSGFYSVNTLLNNRSPYFKKPLIVWGDYCLTPDMTAVLHKNHVAAVMLDRPFWLTQEAKMPDAYCERLQTGSEMTTLVCTALTGSASKVLDNKLIRALLATPAQKLPLNIMKPLLEAAIAQNQADYMPLWANSHYPASSIKQSNGSWVLPSIYRLLEEWQHALVQ